MLLQCLVNGQLRYETPRIDDFDVHQLDGLEFYRGAAETPLELNVKTAACGTVVIWMGLR